MNARTTNLTLPEEELIHPGNRACVGCSLSLAYRHGLKALGKNVLLTVPASCLTVLQGMYPISSMEVPCLNTAFETTAASASGMRAALDALGKRDTTVVAWAGDGGTSDIGIQALSGAAERNTDFIYVCYDNEGYMNTGTQRSGSTPYGAETTTTISGKTEPKKDMPAIMEAHGIPYVATTCPSWPGELYDVFKRAGQMKGTRYIHILIPCPPGWGYDAALTIKMGKEAVACGIFDLFEVIDGERSFYGMTKQILEGKRARKPVAPYIRSQRRYHGITDDRIAEIQAAVDKKWARYEKEYTR
jgi:pyruvate ferredoxin oxidoreductase beta subunit